MKNKSRDILCRECRAWWLVTYIHTYIILHIRNIEEVVPSEQYVPKLFYSDKEDIKMFRFFLPTYTSPFYTEKSNFYGM